MNTWKQRKTSRALAVAVLLLLALTEIVTAQNNFNGFGWTQVGNAISITNYTGAGGAVVIPDTINGLPVTTIGDDTFELTSLTRVTLGTNVITIGFEAFSQCTNLTNIVIPDSVTTIGDYAFEDCSRLTNGTIPKSVTSIGDFAFYECSSLTNITVPASVTNIGSGAFEACSSLTGVTLGAGVTIIVAGTFEDCSSLASVIIPNSVTTIGVGAFGACSSLANVVIPSSVTTIGVGAFDRCFSLGNVTIPASVTSIGDGAFELCYGLAAINVAAQNPFYSSVNGVLFDQGQSTLIQYPGSKAGAAYTIPAGVTNIEASAFNECLNLTTVTIPYGVARIEEDTFSACPNLVTVTIPASVTDIAINAFQDSGLHSITIPGSVTNIEDFAFNGCFNLTNITLAAGLITIGNFAFDECLSLATVTIPATVTTIGAAAFDSCPSLTNITVPASVTNIGGGAFGFCTSLAAINVAAQNPFYTSVNGALFDKGQSTLIQYPGGKTGAYTIPASVTNIGGGAFSFCSSLSSITIPASVNNIGDEAFGFSSLSNVCFEGRPPNYGQEVFIDDPVTVISYISGTPGWGTVYDSIPTAPCAECGGTLQVTITPANAVSAGAEWQVDGSAWEQSGTLTSLPAGSHTIGFLNIAAWHTPSNQVVTLTNGLLTTVAANYTPVVGALQVILSPEEAISAGAQWRVDGGTFLNSGTVVTNLLAGSHTISFKAVFGWSTPADQSIIVSDGVTNLVSGTYVAGAVQVALSPSGAVSAGAQWQMDGGVFLDSGALMTNILAGTHTISFKTIPHWVTPSNQSIIVTDGVTNLVSGIYLANPGAIQVTLKPAGAVSAGAQWQVDSGTFQSNGVILTNVVSGSHTVSFKTIPGWITPANQNLNITSDLTDISSGVYGLLPGATTLPPGNFNGTSVTLNANVSPNGFPTTVYYNYGPQSMCTNFVSASILLSSNLNANQAVPIVVTGLLPGPSYQVQVVASNSVGIILGPVLTFSWPGVMDTNQNDVQTVTWNRNALGQTISGFCCASGPQGVSYTWPNNNNWSQALEFATDPCGDQIVSQPSNWGTNNPPNGTNYNVIVGSQGGAPVNLDIDATVNSFVLQAGGGLNIISRQLAANRFDFQGDFNITTPGSGRLSILDSSRIIVGRD